MAPVTGARRNLRVVLIGFSLMAGFAEDPLMCLWSLCASSLERCLLKSFTLLSVGLFVSRV